MALLGQAAIAMWWNVEPGHVTEFQEWHSKEHLPERLSIPGFNRGSRWQRDGAFFVIYELAEYETLSSPAYRTRLDNPTPWSTAMMPRHRDMVRSQCRVMASHGRGVATFLSTLRLSPAEGRERLLEERLVSMLADLPRMAGITGAHLLRTDTPHAAPTREQLIRGGDAAADWIVLVSGHDAAALASVAGGELGVDALRGIGAEAIRGDGPFRLVHAMTPADAR